MPYSDVNIAIAIFSILTSCVLLLYQFLNHNKSSSEKWFTSVIISNIFMIVGDICQCAFYGVPGGLSRFMQNAFTLMVYFTSSGMMLFSILAWIIFYAKQRTKVNPWFFRIGIIFTAIQALISFTMPLTKICYINENNIYVRGNVFYLSIVFPYLVYIMTFVFLIRYVKQFKKREFVALGSFILLPMFAQLIQMFNGDLIIMNTAVTIGLVGMIIFIQHQREVDKELKITQMAINETKRLEEIRERQDSLNNQLIDVLCGAVEAKDIYTRGHSLRVAQYAREIMYRLGGSEEEQQEVYYIGILHDVGKISIKDEIINKKGKLTDEEYEQIQLHTIAGYQILRGVDIIPDLAIGARWHHERYDGRGYPNGLSGENIPLIARIISVADAYDAMTSNRSYHSTMSQKDVREQIVKGMGTQFDPKIAQIMLDMIDDDLEYDMRQISVDSVINILMIDDDPFMHTMVDTILGKENYVLTFASSGKEGIELLKEYKYDLCLLDKEMPEMDGFEVLEWIHNNIRRMKVIFLTGDKDMETIKKSEQYGAVDYLTKPIKPRILKESIHSVLKH